jgi:hypothetical protein
MSCRNCSHVELILLAFAPWVGVSGFHFCLLNRAALRLRSGGTRRRRSSLLERDRVHRVLHAAGSAAAGTARRPDPHRAVASGARAVRPTRAIMATGTRIMYRSTDARGNPIAVTGTSRAAHLREPDRRGQCDAGRGACGAAAARTSLDPHGPVAFWGAGRSAPQNPAAMDVSELTPLVYVSGHGPSFDGIYRILTEGVNRPGE